MTIAEAKKKLLKAALAYPDAWKDHPWGETVVKVGKKVFVFFRLPRAGLPVPGSICPNAFTADHEAICIEDCCAPGEKNRRPSSIEARPRGKNVSPGMRESDPPRSSARSRGR